MKIFALLTVQKVSLDKIDARRVPIIAIFYHFEGLTTISLLTVTLQVRIDSPAVIDVL